MVDLRFGRLGSVVRGRSLRCRCFVWRAPVLRVALPSLLLRASLGLIEEGFAKVGIDGMRGRQRDREMEIRVCVCVCVCVIVHHTCGPKRPRAAQERLKRRRQVTKLAGPHAGSAQKDNDDRPQVDLRRYQGLKVGRTRQKGKVVLG